MTKTQLIADLTLPRDTLPAPDALLFDMDGVLVDVSQSYRKCIQYTVEQLGGSIDANRIESAKREADVNNDWVLSQRLLAELGINAPLEDITEVFQSLYHGSSGSPGFKQSEESLIELASLSSWAARYPLGIVTGRPRAEAEEFLNRFELQGFFSVVVAMEDAPAKPDPTGVRMACRTLECSTPWMLGDTPDDLLAAKAAGALPIGVAASSNPSVVALSSAGAVTILSNVNQLEELLP